MHKLIATIFAIAFLVFVTVCSDDAPASTQTSPETTSSQGTWSKTQNDTTFEAVITENKIEINMISEGTSYLYWTGSFNTTELTDGDKVISQGDTEALSRSIMGSLEEQKEFSYREGSLSFEFSVMGTTSTVSLDKQ